MPNLRNIQQYYNLKIAALAGQQFTLGRPDYAVADNTPATVTSPILYKVEKTGTSLPQPKGPAMEAYAVFGDRNKIRCGDVLIPLESTLNTPVVTVLNISPVEECNGFRTDRLGEIRNGEEVIFSNVYFDFAPGSAFPGRPLLDNLQDSLNIPDIKVNMFKRDLSTSTRNLEGLMLVEMDTNAEYRWRIKAMSLTGSLMQLVLEEDLIS